MYSTEEKDIMKTRILEEIRSGGDDRNGRSLNDVLKNDLLGEFPSEDTVYAWLNSKSNSYDPSFVENYERAREIRASKIFDEITELADEIDTATYVDKNGNKRTDWGKVNRNKLQIDARKWKLARMSPKKYGDKIETTITGGDKPVQTVDYSKLSPEFLEELAKQADVNKPKS